MNLSATNLLDATCRRGSPGLLGRHGVAPARLGLEITETVLMADPPDRAASSTG